ANEIIATTSGITNLEPVVVPAICRKRIGEAPQRPRIDKTGTSAVCDGIPIQLVQGVPVIPAPADRHISIAVLRDFQGFGRRLPSTQLERGSIGIDDKVWTPELVVGSRRPVHRSVDEAHGFGWLAIFVIAVAFRITVRLHDKRELADPCPVTGVVYPLRGLWCANGRGIRAGDHTAERVILHLD